MDENSSLSWKNNKKLRISVLGSFCEVCGETGCLVGHHIHGKLRGKGSCNDEKRGVLGAILDFFYNWRSCQLRCSFCEFQLHIDYAGGNSPMTNRIQDVNNGKIEQALTAEQLTSSSYAS